MRTRNNSQSGGSPPCRHVPLRKRAGLMLIELLIGSAITTIVIGAVGLLSMAVQSSADYSREHGVATQHARVAIERIERAIRSAHHNSGEVGIAVLTDIVSGWTFPESLVVWRNDANGDQLSQVSELVVFCPNPNNANELWELTNLGDTRVVSLSDLGSLDTIVNSMKAEPASTKTVLTDLLRMVSIPEAGGAVRSAVRFHQFRGPTDAEWKAYQTGSVMWDDLDWPQGHRGSSQGMRQIRIAIEIQLMPDGSADSVVASGQQATPFFGSVATYYQLTK